MKYTAVVFAATIAVAMAQVKNYDQYTPCVGRQDKEACPYQVDYVFRNYHTGEWTRTTCEGGLTGFCQPDNDHVKLICQQANESNCKTALVPSCDKEAISCTPPN